MSRPAPMRSSTPEMATVELIPLEPVAGRPPLGAVTVIVKLAEAPLTQLAVPVYVPGVVETVRSPEAVPPEETPEAVELPRTKLAVSPSSQPVIVAVIVLPGAGFELETVTVTLVGGYPAFAAVPKPKTTAEIVVSTRASFFIISPSVVACSRA